MICWHCQDFKTCPCITCNHGPCVACKGRAKWNTLRPLIANLDIRERRHWKLIRPEAPAHPFRRLIVEEQFDNAAGKPEKRTA